MMQAPLSDPNYSDVESLLEWDEERAAEFVAAEKKKRDEQKKEEKWIECRGKRKCSSVPFEVL